MSVFIIRIATETCLTIYAFHVEDFASFARRSEAIAFDLGHV